MSIAGGLYSAQVEDGWFTSVVRKSVGDRRVHASARALEEGVDEDADADTALFMVSWAAKPGHVATRCVHRDLNSTELRISVTDQRGDPVHDAYVAACLGLGVTVDGLVVLEGSAHKGACDITVTKTDIDESADPPIRHCRGGASLNIDHARVYSVSVKVACQQGRSIGSITDHIAGLAALEGGQSPFLSQIADLELLEEELAMVVELQQEPEPDAVAAEALEDIRSSLEGLLALARRMRELDD